jgi:hypothetical protein
MVAQDLIRVVSKDMDPVWLKSIWDDGETTQTNMIEIIISLALLKIRR